MCDNKREQVKKKEGYSVMRDNVQGALGMGTKR